MKQKTRTKALSWLLSLALVLSLVPGLSIPALATNDKTVAGLGTSAIGNPTNSSATAWTGSYVYYGKYDGTNPTKYRVLDRASNDFGVSGGSLLLDCNTTLYNAPFDADGEANQGATKANEWVYSDLRSGLQGDAFLNKAGVFTEQEKDAIASSTKADAAQNDRSGFNSVSYAALSDDTVFVLDAREASRTSYGYASDGTRKKSGTSGDGWWLRSPAKDNAITAGYMKKSNGALFDFNVKYGKLGVSPAFNINLSSVIFASLITGTAGAAGAEYKLTLKDDALGIAVTSGKKANLNNNQLTIPYTVSGDNSANATQVSVLVTDKAYTESDAKILKYEKLADVTDASLSGKAKFTLPEDLTGTLGTNYHIYLLAEDVNGEKETDYANLVEITELSNHEHSFTYTASGATITATCTPTDEEDVCTLENKTATLTIAAPQHTAVGDGKSADAQITDEGDIQGDSTVSYFATDTNGEKTGSALGSAPTEAGKYWAEITLGAENNAATAHVVYEITNPEYNITLPTGLVGGTVAADKTSAKYGEPITLTVTPETGFTIKTVKYNDTTIDEGVYSFTMPASDVTVSVTFEGQPFTVTTASAPTIGGTVSVTGDGVTTSDGTKAKAGTVVTLTAAPATGFTFGSYTVKTENNETVEVTDNKFTMPAKAVTVSATFVGEDTTATLAVTGNEETTCTAKLLDENYKKIDSVTKKGGEQFILLVNRDEGYDFTVTYGSNSPALLEEFTEKEYADYIAYANEKNLPVSSDMVLARVTMPGVTDNNVTLTVTFSKMQTFTILYQPSPSDTNTTAVWCKFAKTEGGNSVTSSARMHNDAEMGDGTKVFSLKVRAGFSPDMIAFAASKDGLDTANAINNPTVSQNTNTWNNITGGKYLVIGGNAKTVVAAFVTDANAIPFYNSKRGAKPDNYNGVTYQLAVCLTDENGNVTTPGTVTAPAAPQNSDQTIKFVGWRGFQYDAEGKASEKIYKANEQNIPVRENTTFIDTWEPNLVTVTLNLNGGQGVSGDQPVTYGDTLGDALPTMEAPTKDRFAFDGWTVDKTVIEGRYLYLKGSTFIPDTKITSNMGLTADWKHVHTYTCYRLQEVGLHRFYDDNAVHVAFCSCYDYKIMAHEYDSDGMCACGKHKPVEGKVQLDVSYVQLINGKYETKFKDKTRMMPQGKYSTLSASNLWGSDWSFSKWQYSTDLGKTWKDLAVTTMVKFGVMCDMQVRAVYEENANVKPQVELNASKYDDQAVVNGQTLTLDNIAFQMSYKLPANCTFVDGGLRFGDNDGIGYYDIKERTVELSAGQNAANWAGGFVTSLLTFSAPEFTDTSYTERYYELRKNNALDEMSESELAKCIYEGKTTKAKVDPIYWDSKVKTEGNRGAIATRAPLNMTNAEDGNNWIYGIAWMRYKDSSGKIQTIYTNALATTLNGIVQGGSKSVTNTAAN